METYINILLADDDIDDQIFFKEAINRINIVGHNVISVYNGSEALDFLLKRGMYKNSKDSLPDIIILDLNMPVMDGFSAIREIKAVEELRNIPIYVLTTSASANDLRMCQNLGCEGFFTKPTKNSKLTSIIESILEKEAIH